MKNFALIILMLSAFMFSSCEKNDDITVTINESGSLEIKVVDDNKNPVQDASLTLTDVNTGSVIIKEEISSNGIFKMDRILQSSYRCLISAKKDGKTYTMTSYFQIFAKDTKVVEYNPFANAGSINVAVNIDGTVSDITKYMVAVVPYADYTNNVNAIVKYAYHTSALNNDGEAEIKDIPMDNTYILCIYKDNEIYASTTVIMNKKEINVPVNFSIGTLNVNIEGDVANYADYDLVITQYSNNHDISYIKSNALFSAKPDADGKFSFTDLLRSRDYNIYLIKNDVIFDMYNFYFYSSSYVVSGTLTVGSLTIKARNTLTNPSNYSIALADFNTSEITTLKRWAFADGKLNANATIKFTELPYFKYRNTNCYVHIYKDNQIYDYKSLYWYNYIISEDFYFYIYE